MIYCSHFSKILRRNLKQLANLFKFQSRFHPSHLSPKMNDTSFCALVRAFSYEPGRRDRILSSVHMENLIPVTEMKNVQKATKIPVELRSDLSATLQAMHS